MSKIRDLKGTKFGDLIVLNETPQRIKNVTYLKCRCICGTEKLFCAGNLVSGQSVSCGCKRKKTDFRRLTVIFNNMKQRCYNPCNSSYKNYGGRGIKICEEWLNEHKTFYDWAINNGYNNSLTLDRIDSNGNYEPFNCRWVSMEVQQNNRRNNHKITLNGETKNVSQWSKQYGVTRDGFLYKYNHNLL